MARRMGHHYERVNIPNKQSNRGGAIVPIDLVLKYTNEIIFKIMNHNHTCILPNVIKNPYFN